MMSQPMIFVQNSYLPAHKRERLLPLDCILEVHHLLEETKKSSCILASKFKQE